MKTHTVKSYVRNRKKQNNVYPEIAIALYLIAFLGITLISIVNYK